LVDPNGNTKTEGVVGLIRSVAQGCFRSATGFSGCDRACYSDDQGKSGCYANATRFADFKKDFNVISNGLLPGTEGYFRLRLPKGNDFSLDRWDTLLYRCDSETADGSMSIALGIMQTWAKSNPAHTFTTISSCYFAVSDARLAEMAALKNVVVGITISGWFSKPDLDNRVKEIRRFVAAGVPVMVWVATKSGLDNEAMKVLALSLVGPNQIIEVPFHARGFHSAPVLNVNPAGACCTNMVDSAKRPIRNGMVKVDGVKVPHKGRSFSVCRGCGLKCGQSYLRKTQRATA
jgi:hypothetical protein